jgi:hypothetical protein
MGGLVVGACDARPATTEIQVGNSALGIVAFDVSEKPGAELRVTGVGKDGEEIGRVDVILTPSGGRTIAVGVRGRTLTHDDEILIPLHLPLMRHEVEVNTFLLDPTVGAALARWSITFDTRSPGGAEVPYGSGQGSDPNCSYTCNFNWPVGYTGCVESAWFTGYVHEYDCQNSPNVVNWRSCTWACVPGGSIATCTTVDDCPSGCNNSCVNGTCRDTGGCAMTGVNGCASCWTAPSWGSTCSVWVDAYSPYYCDYFYN